MKVRQLITDNNELSTFVFNYLTRDRFSTEIESGVSELCWVDVEVTCDVCRVLMSSYAKSRSDDLVAVVDYYAVAADNIARPEPLNAWISIKLIDATLHGHLRVSLDRCIFWCTNQCGLHHCTHISTQNNLCVAVLSLEWVKTKTSNLVRRMRIASPSYRWQSTS